MYAVVRCGGKQLKVSKGDKVCVERINAEVGENVTLDEVLLVAEDGKLSVGSPLVSGATVTATVADQLRDKKVIVFKKKRRQNYRRRKGHRQYLTVLIIEDISTSGGSKSPAKADKPAAKSAEPKAATKPKDSKAAPKAKSAEPKADKEGKAS